MDLECEKYWILNDFLLLKIQINSKKLSFGRKINLRTWQHLNVYHSIQVEGIVMCLWCCWKDLDNSNWMEFMLWDLGLECWKYGIFSDFCHWKFKWFFKNKVFWKEKSFENVLTLKGLPFNSSMVSFHIWLLKKSIHTLQNNVHILNFPIL